MKKALSILLAGFVPVLVSPAADIGWISFHPSDDTPSGNASAAGFTAAPDVGYTQLLENNGHNVTRIVTTDNAGLDANTLNGFDLLMISRSVPSPHYQTATETEFYNGLSVPTIIMGGYILRNSRLGLTTGGTIPDTFGDVSLQVQELLHPIFEGMPLDGNNSLPYATAIDFMGTTERGISVNTDPLAAGGTVLATVGTSGDPAFGGMVIGEYQAGGVTATGNTLGGHRLVFLSGTREHSGLTSEGAGIFDLTPDGAQLFLNAVDYMAAPVPEPSTLAIVAPALLFFAWRFRRRK